MTDKTMVILGTSILWGQGLPDNEKIHSEVGRLLEQNKIFGDAAIQSIMLAHSGAVLGFKDDHSDDMIQKSRVHGEVPTEYPTVLQQIADFDALSNGLEPEAVDLVLVEGGINDVSLVRLLNPLVSTGQLKQLIEQHCYEHMLLLLKRVAAKFRNAQIILVGYYQIITEQSEKSFLSTFVKALGALPGGFVIDAAAELAGDVFDDRILENCELFWHQSTECFQRAVNEANEQLPRTKTPILFAVPNIKAENAAFAPDPWLYGIHADLSAQDVLAAERAAACEEVGFPRTVVPICDLASAGHPNPKGAKAYAEAIVALLYTQVATHFDYQFEPGSARQIDKQGVWFRDTQGRYALFRGVNMATRSKLPPYLPLLPLDVQTLDAERLQREIAARQPELDRLKQLGFNIVRLVVQWKAIEPRPNPNLSQLLPEGQRYLRLLKEVINALDARGLFVIIDFHQDIAHEAYGGDGFPDWALAIDGQHPHSFSSKEPSHDWMLRYYDTLWTQWDVLVRHTLRSFWNNDLQNEQLDVTWAQQVRTHLERTIGAAARFLSDCQSILGYEAFNEPHQVGLDIRDFETRLLPEYYANVRHEIGDETFLFVEPRVDWTNFSPDGAEFEGLNITEQPITLLDVSRFSDKRVVFSFHYYDSKVLAYGMPSRMPPNIPHGTDMTHKEQEWRSLFGQMRDAAVQRNLIPFLTEFGASQDWTFGTNLRPAIYQNQQVRAYMDLQFKQIEAHLLNAAYWNYELYNTEDGKDNWNWENFSLLGPNCQPRHLDIVARPYPVRSSAEPVFLSFDLQTRHAVIQLKGTPLEAPTVIYVPCHLHYPDGFEVRLTSPEISWDAENQWLAWRLNPAKLIHQLIICPIGAFSEAYLPDESGDLLIDTIYYWNTVQGKSTANINR